LAQVIIENLTKKFGEIEAVRNLYLEVKDRDFTVLLGPSGSGKTTILRCIAGLEAVDNGNIYIDNKQVNDLEPKDRDIAMVFQSYALYPHMTVYQNLSFPLECSRVPKKEIRKRVLEVAHLLRIQSLLSRRPGKISGGQQQRVALGRALIRKPKVFLMDEPLSNLDAKLRTYMRAELKKLQKELGITTIYVTHDQVEAMTMADKVAILNEGLLQQFDTPYSIYSKPANLFVSGFIGSPPMNFFECTLKKENLLDAGEFKYHIDNKLIKNLDSTISNEVILGIRPGHIIVRKHQKIDQTLIKSTLYMTEPLGDMTILDLKIGNKIVKVTVEADFDIQNDLWLEFPTNKVHLFDKKTGKTLN
jgi:multiple sugar transport system ATP-binding protein